MNTAPIPGSRQPAPVDAAKLSSLQQAGAPGATTSEGVVQRVETPAVPNKLSGWQSFRALVSRFWDATVGRFFTAVLTFFGLKKAEGAGREQISEGWEMVDISDAASSVPPPPPPRVAAAEQSSNSSTSVVESAELPEGRFEERVLPAGRRLPSQLPGGRKLQSNGEKPPSLDFKELSTTQKEGADSEDVGGMEEPAVLLPREAASAAETEKIQSPQAPTMQPVGPEPSTEKASAPKEGETGTEVEPDKQLERGTPSATVEEAEVASDQKEIAADDAEEQHSDPAADVERSAEKTGIKA
jgi:hypothetical protein